MLTRRTFLKTSALAFLSLGLKGCSLPLAKNLIKTENDNFNSTIYPDLTDDLELPANYHYQIIASFGDNIFGGKDFDFASPLSNQNKINQYFGYNNDYCAYFPINGAKDHGLLCVNHEYLNLELIFATQFLRKHYKNALKMGLEMLGHSIFEIKKENRKWGMVKNQKFNRRITPNTICLLAGAAKNSARIKALNLPAGQARGIIANCGGGKTPWNTVLIAEENFDNFFGGDFSKSAEEQNLLALNFKKTSKEKWERYFPRFNLSKNVLEANSFGYIVEIDPFDPRKPPIKRTSLGRFKHESAAVCLDNSGHIIVYMGDDENFEHLYKFVSKNKFDPANPKACGDLLDEGILYVGQFFADGKLKWQPLIYGQNGLDKTNNFADMADVIIETRRAAKLIGATKLDRPEGIAISPKTQKIYISLTNNSQRKDSDIASPDAPNIHGYILEIDVKENHYRDNAQWKIFLQASASKSRYALSNPDNLNFDSEGNLWVATDGMAKSRGVSDSVFKIDMVSGKIERLLNSPNGCEICGPEFTPDSKTMFLNIQHPGEGSNFSNPSTRWPNLAANHPPLPSLVAIEKI